MLTIVIIRFSKVLVGSTLRCAKQGVCACVASGKGVYPGSHAGEAVTQPLAALPFGHAVGPARPGTSATTSIVVL